jgi:homoserine O-acetyltransferase
MHGTGGSGGQFTGRGFAGELFLPGQALDITKYFIVMPDDIGHGKSSKPSDGLRAKFPRYGYQDMLTAEHRLLTEGLGVNHLRLVMGTSMGGMHTWLWGERWPDFMDALLDRSPAAIASGAASSSTRFATIRSGRGATTVNSRRAPAPRRRCCGW